MLLSTSIVLLPGTTSPSSRPQDHDKKKVSAISCCSLSLICLISADTVPVECRVGAHDRRLLAIRCWCC